jgi:hypothetical protein
LSLATGGLMATGSAVLAGSSTLSVRRPSTITRAWQLPAGPSRRRRVRHFLPFRDSPGRRSCYATRMSANRRVGLEVKVCRKFQPCFLAVERTDATRDSRCCMRTRPSISRS